MTERYFNGTPHQINIFREEDVISIQNGRKFVLKTEQTEPILVVPSGTALNAVKTTLPPREGAPSWETGAVVFSSYDSIPESGDVVIVSALYRAAVVECGGSTSRLGTVCDVVYKSEEDLKPVGCLRIAVG